MRRLVGLLLAALTAVGLVSACTAPAPKPPLRVEMWGDSIGMQSASYVNFFLGLSGKAVGRNHTFPGTAMCDWFSDIRNELDPANRSGFHPQAIVMVFTGVGYTSCVRRNGVPLTSQALINKYQADAQTIIAIAAKARVPVYFASAPIYRAQASLYVGDTPLGVMESKLPARNPGKGVRFIDAALSVELHGHYTATLPCLPGEKCTGRWPDGQLTVVVREADGGHFCPVKEVATGDAFGLTTCPVYSPGARRYAVALTSRIFADFHLR
jgi:hypothetical protein